MSANQYYNANPNNGNNQDQQKYQQQQQQGQSQYYSQHNQGQQQGQQQDQQDRGLFSTVVGAGIGGYAGKKLTNDSKLGKLAGGLIGGYVMRHGVPSINSHDKKHGKK